MPKYQVRLLGENFLIEVDGSVQRMGFYVTRYVDAVDAEHAEIAAVDLIRSDPKLDGLPRNSKDDPPMLHLDEIWVLPSFDKVENLFPGFVFFAEDDE